MIGREVRKVSDVQIPDFSDPETFEPGMPHQAFAWLREHEPVHWQPASSRPAPAALPDSPAQRGFWMITGYHDLQAIFDQLNALHFAGGLEARITWGPVTSRGRRRRSIKMGSFAVEDRIIRIHPALDQDCVPDYFVAWIVYHEMLHGKHEVKRENGRRRFHSAEFLAEERQFPQYERACAWEKQNLDRLLRAGTTSLEAKSGYGLCAEHELLSLELLAEAHLRMESLEHGAHILLTARLLGRVNPLGTEDARKFEAARRQAMAARMTGEWRAADAGSEA